MRKKFCSVICMVLFAVSQIGVKAQSNGGLDFTFAAEKTVHGVVHIQCETTVQSVFYDDFFSFLLPPQSRERSYQTSGSGVIISEDGYVITNNHVVQDAETINVVLNDKRSFVARLVGNDPSSDLAVIKIEADGLEPLQFGNSDEVKIGEWVLAVGNPFNLTSTVTAGIVSAKARNINILGNKMSNAPIESFIQTDAAVNPGNSGGALVNLKGELVGINTAIASSTGSYTGYSFAIPSNIVRKVTSDLIQYGMTQKANIGVHFAEMDSKLAEVKGIKSVRGIYIGYVIKDGAADKAGIKDGDIITSIDGKSVNSNAEFNEVLAQHSPGDVVKVAIERDGKPFYFDVTLFNSMGNTDIIRNDTEAAEQILSGSFREVNDKEKQQYGISKGIVIEKVGKSPFARLGIKNGFIITSIDKKVNISIEDIRQLEKKKGKLIVEGFYPNDSRTYYFVLVL
ncbi:MAG: trypsin-like peptidase domain-containing protein [Candidatus Onthomorpha sp.]|nr:trypsin-like peptidase domain-containing protein [Bacteroidales bacterium]MDY4862407.1 trypsin-like peptidase domain-containing protein [Candidatus Onthomorpha sp.]MCI7035019.1 trypsin-like peptidase domain-containing protein [Bacteroidales bacterium]MCI7562409.1 trypsin-like peptidase domain-containing protein [Bacteroidales bacterium]MCI7572582.1 trypsin-like peptidase domain-containing protein [Bacteroidales bacterium]